MNPNLIFSMLGIEFVKNQSRCREILWKMDSISFVDTENRKDRIGCHEFAEEMGSIFFVWCQQQRKPTSKKNNSISLVWTPPPPKHDIYIYISWWDDKGPGFMYPSGLIRSPNFFQKFHSHRSQKPKNRKFGMSFQELIRSPKNRCRYSGLLVSL